MPNSVDNSELQYFPPIRTQGDIGSYTAFSSTYYQMTHMAALEMVWNVKDNNDNSNKFSPKWSFNLVNGKTDGGSEIVDICRLLQRHGAAFWSDFPYIPSKSNPLNYRAWATDASTWENAINYRLDKMGYISLLDGTNTPITSPESAILNVYVQESGIHPVAFRVARAYSSAGGLQLQRDGAVLCSLDIPSTGGDEIFTTVYANVYLKAGFQTLRVLSTGHGWNFNWMEITK